MDTICLFLMFINLVLQDQCLAVSNQMINTQKIMTDLFADYEPNILPIEENEGGVYATNITLGLTVIGLVSLNEHAHVLDINTYLAHSWSDTRLSWNSSQYGGVSFLRSPVDRIWVPDITLYNGLSEMYKYNKEKCVIHSSGNIFWIPAVRMQAMCAVNLQKFPFDEQTCTLKFGSWIHHGNIVNLIFRDPESALQIEMDVSGKGWTLVNSSVIRNVKYYACCPEPYPSIDYTFVLRRNPVYYIHVYILPAVLLSFLVPFQLVLPPESTERLILGVGLILSNLLMILRLQDVLPTAHLMLPAIGMFYSLNLTWSCLGVFATILVLNIHNRGPRKDRVPDLIRLIFLGSLRRIVCLGGDNYYQFDTTESVSMRGLENPCIPSSPGDGYKDKEAKNGSKLEKDVEEIVKHVNVLAGRSSLQERRCDIRNEWYQLAIVIDRIFFFFFFLTFLIYTLVVMA